MTAYFVATNPDHTALLLAGIRAHPDLATIAAQVESDVVEYFTRRYPTANDYANEFYVGRGYALGNGVYVGLLGYDPDASKVTDTALVTNLRQTIADVLTWRLSKTDLNPALASASTAIGVSKQAREEARFAFPPGHWDWRLRRWNIVAPVYTV
jgi:hypothetical protein